MVTAALGLRPQDAEAQCEDCIEWWTGSAWKHKFTDEWRPLPFLYYGDHTWEAGGKCEDHHEECFSVADLAELATDLDALRKAIAGGVPTVVFNQERRALQLMSCEGNLIGHWQLSEEQLAAVLE
jgi:hypothetical protein